MGEQLDLFSQLSEDQQREIIERWAVAEYRASHGIAARPESRFTGQFVRFQRQMWGWKKETLASFADVSLSTIERIERGDRVGDDCLDRVAVALGYKRGDFTEPRVPLAGDEAVAFLERCLKPFEGHRWIDVEPVCKQRQIAAFADCHLYLIDGGRLNINVSDELAALWEEIDFIAFVRDDTFVKRSKREARRIERRRLYNTVLGRIREIECLAHAIALGGTYEAETDHPLLPEAQVAVIGFFPKQTDPGAIKRRQLLAPKLIHLSQRSVA